MTPADRAFHADLLDILEHAFMDKELKVFDIARAIGYSERHLLRRVRAVTGMTPAQYLSEYRLIRARHYLRVGAAVSDAARAAGFASHAYFTHRFKGRFGLTPSEFKARTMRPEREPTALHTAKT